MQHPSAVRQFLDRVIAAFRKLVRCHTPEQLIKGSISDTFFA